MTVESFVYNNIPDVFLDEAGYFNPPVPFKPLSDRNFVININNKKITKDTLVLYYPGSFGFFHEGHYDIVCRAINDAKQLTDDYVLVISPANSDYSASKYGNSSFASNKHRTNRILSVIGGTDLNIIIDLNPMLNFEVDHNFTDLLDNFIKMNSVCDIVDMKYTPVIVAGKDRNFSILNDLTNMVQCWFYDEKVVCSTSKNFTPLPLKKKKLFLRVHTKQEYDLFCSFFSNWYNGIEPIFIKDEIEFVKSLPKNDMYITICKDYADLLPYVKLSREYDTPLSEPYHNSYYNKTLEEYIGYTVVDSDIYSGSTRKFVENLGLKMVSYINLEDCTDEVELLDIDDFKKPDFTYPFVDLTSKCSMPVFTLNEHQIYNRFKEKLKML